MGQRFVDKDIKDEFDVNFIDNVDLDIDIYAVMQVINVVQLMMDGQTVILVMKLEVLFLMELNEKLDIKLVIGITEVLIKASNVVVVVVVLV